MQSLDIISVNLWQILISLANLTLLFFIIKKFLFKPLQNMLDQRKAELDGQYSAAAQAEQEALETKESWENKMQTANAEADAIMQSATENAKWRGEKIVAEAQDKADGIIRQAETEAELERKKAQAGIKREIVDVSAALTEKMLGREINAQDHRALIDSFIEEIGENDDRNE